MRMKKIKVLSMCDGVATGLRVLKKMGFDVEYHAIEIDETKRKIADANHPGIIRPGHDVIAFSEAKKFQRYDLVICGFTCTSLSSQGKRDEWEGESKIFFNCVEILEGCMIKNKKLKFFFENVASMSNAARDQISELLGVDHYEGDAGLVSLQDRVRYYWMNWTPAPIEPRTCDVSTVLDPDGLMIFTFSKSNRNKKGEPAIVKGRIKPYRCGTLVTGDGCRGQSTATMVVTKKLGIRNLRALECARLQGLHDYEWPCSDAKIFEAVGEGWQSDMIQELFKGINYSPMMAK